MKKTNLGILLLILGLFITGCNSIESPTGEVVNEINKNDFVSIPLSDVTTTMEKYSLEVGGIQVNYFTVLGSDGEVRTAFDACDICGGYKGYSQQGTDVVCNNCGKVFRIEDIGRLNTPGGCWPSFLSHEIKEENVLINKAEIAKGAYRFK